MQSLYEAKMSSSFGIVALLQDHQLLALRHIQLNPPKVICLELSIHSYDFETTCPPVAQL